MKKCYVTNISGQLDSLDNWIKHLKSLKMYKFTIRNLLNNGVTKKWLCNAIYKGIIIEDQKPLQHGINMNIFRLKNV